MAQTTCRRTWEMSSSAWPEELVKKVDSSPLRQGSSVPPRLGRGVDCGPPPLLSPGNCILVFSFILQVANGRIQSLEATVEKLLTSESKLKQAALALELERSALLQTVQELQRRTAELSGPRLDRTPPKPTGD